MESEPEPNPKPEPEPAPAPAPPPRTSFWKSTCLPFDASRQRVKLPIVVRSGRGQNRPKPLTFVTKWRERLKEEVQEAPPHPLPYEEDRKGEEDYSAKWEDEEPEWQNQHEEEEAFDAGSLVPDVKLYEPNVGFDPAGWDAEPLPDVDAQEETDWPLQEEEQQVDLKVKIERKRPHSSYADEQEDEEEESEYEDQDEAPLRKRSRKPWMPKFEVMEGEPAVDARQNGQLTFMDVTSYIVHDPKLEIKEEDEAKRSGRRGDNHKTYGCPFCPFQHRKGLWLAHLRAMHAQEHGLLFCEKVRNCFAPYQSQDMLDRHVEEVHGAKKFTYVTIYNMCANDEVRIGVRSAAKSSNSTRS